MSHNERVTDIFHRQLSNHSPISVKERLKKLSNMEDWIKTNRQAIFDAHYDDLRKPESEVELGEIWYVLSEIKLAKKRLTNWTKPLHVGISTLALIPARSWIHYEPKGVVLIIAPWNFPFNLSVGPLVSALAAGNRVILKPSEMAPNVSSLVKKMVDDLFQPEEVAVCLGDAEVAKSLLELPFHHIFFTGSPAVGKIVMSAAAKHLSSITLELGGKSPTILDETADINLAAKKIAWGKCLNLGQSCIAPDYLLVHKSRKEEFLEKLSKRIDEVFGDTFDEKESSPNLTHVVNEGHWDRLNDLLTSAVKQGATIVHGGGKNKESNFIEPTILDNVTQEMKIMKEEIFGPLLPVTPFDKLDDCLDIINSKPKPLALYLFSNSRKNINRIIDNTSSGGMVINEVKTHFLNLNLPFGGVNTSGFGRSHGFEGFKTFCNERTMLKNGKTSLVWLIFPPYTSIRKKIIRFVTRYL